MISQGLGGTLTADCPDACNKERTVRVDRKGNAFNLSELSATGLPWTICQLSLFNEMLFQAHTHVQVLSFPLKSRASPHPTPLALPSRITCDLLAQVSVVSSVSCFWKFFGRLLLLFLPEAKKLLRSSHAQAPPCFAVTGTILVGPNAGRRGRPPGCTLV